MQTYWDAFIADLKSNKIKDGNGEIMDIAYLSPVALCEEFYHWLRRQNVFK